MSDPGPAIRNISDTARWIAAYRADETERPDAVFSDPLARRLAGERGRRIVDTVPGGRDMSWALVARTWTFDRYVAELVAGGADLVLNLAAGFDTRPYRMELPKELLWVEADLPALMDEKDALLAGETPRCRLERVRVDLADPTARRALLAGLGRRSRKAVVITEGLLIYLEPAQAEELVRDLGAVPSFAHWMTDLASPGLLRMMSKQVGRELDGAAAPFRFAPAEGPAFFERCGWTLQEVHSNLKTGAKLKRLSLLMRLAALLPDPKGPAGKRPWSGNCLFRRS
jgi:methyltransferase (TIGR00027 family)